ncbi:Peptidase [Chitinophaga costaii]|uniref:Peptidase n=1 Tax=Chitinophaga costaii TaxID=1335309 RepID=A0A1C4G1U8_9BACT|nr:basic secretory protein-like protein [Chitinophaga costaii]PUZ19955.1 secretory protein [Chitinophaga costaii]SCC61741.1 Peptidase [Chitinophaga costaii]
MNHRFKKVAQAGVITALCLAPVLLKAQDERTASDTFYQRDTTVKNGFTLIFINKAESFDLHEKQRLIDAFFTVYPKEVAHYNKESLKKVFFIIDPAYKGVAATGGGVARYNPEWLTKNPEDIDVVTHEVMHIVQAYPNGSGPGWLTEGIADYVRAEYGVNNTAAKWSLPDYKDTQSYKNSYRITARFLQWLVKNKNPEMVDKLDAAMRNKTYTNDIWKQLAKADLDTLWKEYGEHPAI